MIAVVAEDGLVPCPQFTNPAPLPVEVKPGAAIPPVSVQVTTFAVVIPSSQRELATVVELPALYKKASG